MYTANITFENNDDGNKVYFVDIYKFNEHYDCFLAYSEGNMTENRAIEVLSEFGLEDEFDTNTIEEKTH